MIRMEKTRRRAPSGLFLLMGRFCSCRASDDSGPGGHVTGDDGAGTDDGIVADGDAGKDDGGAANPNVGADADGAAVFEMSAADLGGAGVVGCVDLRVGADLGEIADLDGADVEENAVEVEEDSATDADVVSVVDEEGWADDGAVADGGEDLFELDEVRGGVVRGGVVFVQERSYMEAVGGEGGIVRVVELAGEHLFFLGFGGGVLLRGMSGHGGLRCERCRWG
jgi:hypothetical protein